MTRGAGVAVSHGHLGDERIRKTFVVPRSNMEITQFLGVEAQFARTYDPPPGCFREPVRGDEKTYSIMPQSKDKESCSFTTEVD